MNIKQQHQQNHQEHHQPHHHLLQQQHQQHDNPPQQLSSSNLNPLDDMDDDDLMPIAIYKTPKAHPHPNNRFDLDNEFKNEDALHNQIDKVFTIEHLTKSFSLNKSNSFNIQKPLNRSLPSGHNGNYSTRPNTIRKTFKSICYAEKGRGVETNVEKLELSVSFTLYDADTCTICLNVLAQGQAFFVAGCGHRYHFKCLMELKKVNYMTNSCPICGKSLDSSHESIQKSQEFSVPDIKVSGIFSSPKTSPSEEEVLPPQLENFEIFHESIHASLDEEHKVQQTPIPNQYQSYNRYSLRSPLTPLPLQMTPQVNRIYCELDNQLTPSQDIRDSNQHVIRQIENSPIHVNNVNIFRNNAASNAVYMGSNLYQMSPQTSNLHQREIAKLPTYLKGSFGVKSPSKINNLFNASVDNHSSIDNIMCIPQLSPDHSWELNANQIFPDFHFFSSDSCTNSLELSYHQTSEEIQNIIELGTRRKLIFSKELTFSSSSSSLLLNSSNISQKENAPPIMKAKALAENLTNISLELKGVIGVSYIQLYENNELVNDKNIRYRSLMNGLNNKIPILLSIEDKLDISNEKYSHDMILILGIKCKSKRFKDINMYKMHIENILKILTDNDIIAIILLGDESNDSEILINLTKSTKEIISLITSIFNINKFKGKFNIFNGLNKAIKLLSIRKYNSNFASIITIIDEYSFHDISVSNLEDHYNEFVKLLKEKYLLHDNTINFYFIECGNTKNPIRLLDKLVNQFNGIYYNPTNPKKLSKAFQLLIEYIQNLRYIDLTLKITSKLGKSIHIKAINHELFQLNDQDYEIKLSRMIKFQKINVVLLLEGLFEYTNHEENIPILEAQVFANRHQIFTCMSNRKTQFITYYSKSIYLEIPCFKLNTPIKISSTVLTHLIRLIMLTYLEGIIKQSHNNTNNSSSENCSRNGNGSGNNDGSCSANDNRSNNSSNNDSHTGNSDKIILEGSKAQLILLYNTFNEMNFKLTEYNSRIMNMLEHIIQIINRIPIFYHHSITKNRWLSYVMMISQSLKNEIPNIFFDMKNNYNKA